MEKKKIGHEGKAQSRLNKINCPHCNSFVKTGNFCNECRGKIVKTCDCWILHVPYDCGKSRCPKGGKARADFIMEYYKKNSPTH